jgi:putative ABC transport system permease protein
MIRNYLLITYRSMLKNSAFIITSVFGLAIAIAICIVTYLAYQYDATFDTCHQNGERIYRVSSVRDFNNSLTRFGYCPLPLGEIADKTIADVEKSSAYLSSGSNFKRGQDLFAANLSYVDPEFFEMFLLEFIVGSATTLGKSDAVISELMAVRLFNTPTDALGKTITQVYGSELKEVRIAGVFREPPMNSSFFRQGGSSYMHSENYKDEFIQAQPNNWKEFSTLFVQISKPELVSGVLKELQPFTANNNQVHEDFQMKEFTLDRFSLLAHSDRDESIRAATAIAPPVAAILGSVIMAILILLIACFNLTNTSIAISSQRLKEIGIRKVMGSQRIQLIAQFIGETTAISLLALIIGFALSDFMVEAWNMMTNNNIHLEPNYFDTPGFLVFLIGILLFTGIVAGSYPAFYISKFQPISIFKGNLIFGGTNYFTRTLLGLQFAISLMAIISAIAFMQNAKYQRDYDLGFDVRGSVIARVNDHKEFETYKNALGSNPQVLSIAGAKSSIFSNRLHEPVKFQSSQAEVDIIEVGENYLSTMDLKLLRGRDFIKDSETDRKESVIITQKMAELFKLDDPLGKELIWKDSIRLYVIGVVKNVYTHGLWLEMQPLMIRCIAPSEYNQVIVSVKPEHVSSINTWMNKQWNIVFPNRLYNGYMLGTTLHDVTALNNSIMYGYLFLGLIAMMLSATGLYTLLSLNIIRRTKEIGIRKIVGASVLSITRVVNTEFVIILVLASLLGSWAAYNWCNVIMGSIWKYHQGTTVWTFMIAIGLMFTVCFLTIAHKLFAVATMNPIQALKDE